VRWRTDLPCPVCWTGLIVEDDGGTTAWVECRLCGYGTTLDLAAGDTDGGDAW
jgi:hypothetical protein